MVGSSGLERLYGSQHRANGKAGLSDTSNVGLTDTEVAPQVPTAVCKYRQRTGSGASRARSSSARARSAKRTRALAWPCPATGTRR
jgi:hypothetical protein